MNAGVASAKLTNPLSRIECRRRRGAGNRLTSNARDRDIDLTRVAPLTFRSPLKNRLSAKGNMDDGLDRTGNRHPAYGLGLGSRDLPQ